MGGIGYLVAQGRTQWRGAKSPKYIESRCCHYVGKCEYEI